MKTEKEVRAFLNQNVFNILAIDYVRTNEADPKFSYSLGLVAGLSASIGTICFLYTSNNSNGDHEDINSFHKVYLDIGTFKYTGNDTALKASEILKIKEELIAENMVKMENDYYIITHT
jgi:hypothetical protein